jgi:hypothetical protein
MLTRETEQVSSPGKGGLARAEILMLRLSLELLRMAQESPNAHFGTPRVFPPVARDGAPLRDVRLWAIPSPYLSRHIWVSCSNILAAPFRGLPSELGPRSWDFLMSFAPPLPGFLENLH